MISKRKKSPAARRKQEARKVFEPFAKLWEGHDVAVPTWTKNPNNGKNYKT